MNWSGMDRKARPRTRGGRPVDGTREGRTYTIKNRDIPLLNDLFGIMQLTVRTEERREWQRDRMTSLSQHLTGMPGSGKLPSGLDDAFARLSELDEEHGRHVKEYTRKMRKAQNIVNGIASDSMRAFVVLKYLLNLPDTEIREALNMTKYGFEQARKCIEEAPDMESVVWREKYIVQD